MAQLQDPLSRLSANPRVIQSVEKGNAAAAAVALKHR